MICRRKLEEMPIRKCPRLGMAHYLLLSSWSSASNGKWFSEDHLVTQAICSGKGKGGGFIFDLMLQARALEDASFCSRLPFCSVWARFFGSVLGVQDLIGWMRIGLVVVDSTSLLLAYSSLDSC